MSILGSKAMPQWSAMFHITEAPRGQVWSRRIRLEDADDSFDLAFWQAQSAEARFAAAWEMVETAWELKQGQPDELRLQRTVGRFVRMPG